MLAEQLTAASDSRFLSRLVLELLRDPDLSREDRETLQNQERSRMNALGALGSALSEPDDAPELYRTVAAFWLQLRFESQRYALVAAHQGAQAESTIGLLMARRALVDATREALERLMAASDTLALASCALELLDQVRPGRLPGASATGCRTDRPVLMDETETGERLMALAGKAHLESMLEEFLEGLSGDTATSEAATHYAEDLCRGLRDLGMALSGAPLRLELYRALAAMWLELRFEWQRHNMVLNYQACRGAASDPAMFASAAIASWFLGRIEQVLSAEDQIRLSSFAAELIAGSDDELRIHGLVDSTILVVSP